MSVDVHTVWTGPRHAGIFPSLAQAVTHCKVIANDHRPRPELDELAPGVLRYLGPRGRRHGLRFCAFILTAAAIETLRTDLGQVLRFLPKEL